MTTAHAHEIAKCRREVQSLERELTLRAETISAQADLLATTRAELDEAVRVGTEYAQALAFSVPNHPLVLLEGVCRDGGTPPNATGGEGQ